jgi:hypothetical protein
MCGVGDSTWSMVVRVHPLFLHSWLTVQPVHQAALLLLLPLLPFMAALPPATRVSFQRHGGSTTVHKVSTDSHGFQERDGGV